MPEHIRRSNNAAGICVIAAIMAFETSALHHAAPRPATPYVVGVLAVVALGALAASLWYRLAAKKTSGRER